MGEPGPRFSNVLTLYQDVSVPTVVNVASSDCSQGPEGSELALRAFANFGGRIVFIAVVAPAPIPAVNSESD